jgi:hypothetical protein
MKTLNQIASAIDNNVRSGIKGVTNSSYSIEQLEHEVIIERERMIELMVAHSTLIKTDGLTQDIICPVGFKKLSPASAGSPNREKLHFRMPALVSALEDDAIEYIGPISREDFSWRVYVGADHVLHKFRAATCKRPYVMVNPAVAEDGMVDCYVMNYQGRMKEIPVTAVFANPELVRTLGNYNTEDIHFPVSGGMAEELIKVITNKYLQNFRKLHAPTQNNDQTDKVS